MSLRLTEWPHAAITIARTYGFKGGWLRASHELRRALGRFQTHARFTARSPRPEQIFLAADKAKLASGTFFRDAIERANRVSAGEYQAYRNKWRRIPSTSEEWLRHPETQHAYPNVAWWKINHADSLRGDIKDVWEPARLAFVYDLVRAYLLTGDEAYAASFAEYFCSWATSAPPFVGVHWSCGQECAIRATALLYAEANFGEPLLKRLGIGDQLWQTISASGERISDAIGYAVSQRNNHGISEATGLVVIGTRLMGAHPQALKWIRTGQRLLNRLIKTQFAPDGWYIQHSFAYQRLAIDQCVIAERALRLIGSGLHNEAVARLRQSTELLIKVVDPTDGGMPNHGSVDGAFVHPITTATYRDFRPTITAAAATWDVPVPENISQDAEVLAWLACGPPPVVATLPDGVYAGESGWVAAQRAGVKIFMRAGRYTARPGHLDVLHIDVRANGRELIVDPGTYAYNQKAPWRNGLAVAAVHNGPLINNEEPGVRGPRFLWLRWPSARLVSYHADDEGIRIVAERPRAVRRSVTLTDDELVIRDSTDVLGVISSCWLLHPAVDPSILEIDGSVERGRGEEDRIFGWFSPYYGERIQTNYAIASRDGPGGQELVTRMQLRWHPKLHAGLVGKGVSSEARF